MPPRQRDRPHEMQSTEPDFAGAVLDLPAVSSVHLWRAAIATIDVPSVTGVLSEKEQQRAVRYRFERDRREFKVARAMLRLTLAAYTGKPAASLCFQHGPGGKPSLGGDVQFNLSHAGGVVLIAVARLPVGIDVERVNPHFDWEPIARQFFSEVERDWIGARPAEVRTASFFRCWTRREAYVKARGRGVPTEGACGLATTMQADDHNWTIESCVPFPEYIGAVAAQTEGLAIQIFDWPPPELRENYSAPEHPRNLCG